MGERSIWGTHLGCGTYLANGNPSPLILESVSAKTFRIRMFGSTSRQGPEHLLNVEVSDGRIVGVVISVPGSPFQARFESVVRRRWSMVRHFAAKPPVSGPRTAPARRNGFLKFRKLRERVSALLTRKSRNSGFSFSSAAQRELDRRSGDIDPALLPIDETLCSGMSYGSHVSI